MLVWCLDEKKNSGFNPPSTYFMSGRDLSYSKKKVVTGHMSCCHPYQLAPDKHILMHSPAGKQGYSYEYNTKKMLVFKFIFTLGVLGV